MNSWPDFQWEKGSSADGFGGFPAHLQSHVSSSWVGQGPLALANAAWGCPSTQRNFGLFGSLLFLSSSFSAIRGYATIVLGLSYFPTYYMGLKRFHGAISFTSVPQPLGMSQNEVPLFTLKVNLFSREKVTLFWDIPISTNHGKNIHK